MTDESMNLEDQSTLSEHQKKIVGLGKICHETIRAFSETMNDFTTPPWDQTQSWYQRVMVECVTFLLKEQRDISQLHSYWGMMMGEKKWRYGIKFNEKTKEHPNMKEFERLSFEEQLKYALMLSNVIAMSPALVRAHHQKAN
jgi:hypothetical protein